VVKNPGDSLRMARKSQLLGSLLAFLSQKVGFEGSGSPKRSGGVERKTKKGEGEERRNYLRGDNTRRIRKPRQRGRIPRVKGAIRGKDKLVKNRGIEVARPVHNRAVKGS